jgi:hypothetical protein
LYQNWNPAQRDQHPAIVGVAKFCEVVIGAFPPSFYEYLVDFWPQSGLDDRVT